MKSITLLVTLASATMLAGCGSDSPTETPTTLADATYNLTFQSDWSSATHPDSFPPSPHFSGLIGGTHDTTVTFWEVGSVASTGMKDMAEKGRKFPLDTAVMTAIQSGTAEYLLSGDGVSLSPGAVVFTFTVSTDYPLVTLVSMIAPSPDWFVGVSELSMLQNGQWRDTVVVSLNPYDAGTDDGTSYTSPNAVTTPPGVISQIMTSPFLVNSMVPPLGTFTFVRQ